METEVGVEGNEEGKLLEESEVEKLCSSLASPRQIANPVVYKLVRVEGDGRFVPATDDEVMEVADLFLDDNIDTDFLDTGQTLECFSGDGMHQLSATEGLLLAENPDFLPDEINVQLQETVSEFVPDLCESHMTGYQSAREFPDSLENFIEDGALSLVVDSSIPDFSKVNGEICLDDLSIKELQETFRATFGRETSVKDKQWLKRRIAMGLTNSCDVSASSFTIRDNKLVDNDISCNNVAAFIGSDQLSEARNCNEGRLPSIQSSEQKDDQVTSDERLRGGISDSHRDVDDHTEERAAKRVRKPTKRYIEELSETESKEAVDRLMAVDPNSRLGQQSPNSHMRLVRNVSLGARTVIIRMDSLGGYEIQIPCVSRVRRSRPRKDFMTLLKFNGIDVTTTVVKKAFGEHIDRPDNENENVNMVKKAQLTSKQAQSLLVDVHDKDRQAPPVMGAVRKEPKHVDSSGDSDDNVATVPTPKGGMRRKHHRAWALSEVIKLVDGVSKYGAGRWSEIKRLSFASSPFRTSVDLKDKWRNLLKASFAQAPAEKGISSRKSAAATPLPATILLRVRELAEMQSLVRPGSNKVAGNSSPGDNVN